MDLRGISNEFLYYNNNNLKYRILDRRVHDLPDEMDLGNDILNNNVPEVIINDFGLHTLKPKEKKSNALDVEFGKLMTPTHTKLTEPEKQKADLVEASHQAYAGGIQAAQFYLNNKNSPYKIDEELSSRDHIVAIKDGKATIAFRGTEPSRADKDGKKAAPYDITAWLPVVLGFEEHHAHFTDAMNVVQDTIDKYGKPEEFHGFSLGGMKAIKMGERYNVQTTTFNPLLGNTFTGKLKSKHNIIRTTEDIATSLAATVDKRENVKIKQILPNKIVLNPVEAHDMSNFTKRPSEDKIAQKYKISPETEPLMTHHINEFNNLKRHITGQHAIALKNHIQEQSSGFINQSANVFSTVADISKKSIENLPNKAVDAVKNSVIDTGLEAGADFITSAVSGQSSSLPNAAQFAGNVASKLKRGAVGAALSPIIEPLDEGIGELAKGTIHTIFHTKKDDVATEVVGEAVEGAASSVITGLATEALIAGVTGAEFGAGLGVPGMVVGAGIGALVGAGVSLASIYFNENDTHREAIIQKANPKPVFHHGVNENNYQVKQVAEHHSYTRKAYEDPAWVAIHGQAQMTKSVPGAVSAAQNAEYSRQIMSTPQTQVNMA